MCKYVLVLLFFNFISFIPLISSHIPMLLLLGIKKLTKTHFGVDDQKFANRLGPL